MEASYAPVKNQTIPLLSPTTEMRLMHADSWLQPMVPMNGGLPTPGVRPQQSQLQQQPPLQSQQQQQHTVVVLDELDAVTPLTSDGMEDYQDLSKFMPLQQQCDSLVGESIIDVELNKEMRNENVEVSNIWQREIGENSIQAIEKKSLFHGDNIATDVRRSQMTSHVPTELDHAYPLVAGQNQLVYFNNNNNNISNNNNNINAKINAGDDNYIYKNDNVWVSPIAKEEQTYFVDRTDDAWSNSNRFTKMTDQQKVSEMTIPEVNVKKQFNRENSQELLQILEKADNFDLLSYIGEDDMNLSPVDSVSTTYSHVTDSSVPRTPSNSSALVAVSPRTYEPVPLKPMNSFTTSVDPLQARLRAATKDIPRPVENLRFAHNNIRATETTATTTTSSMGYELRPIKQEKPESSEDDLTELHLIERRSMRQRRTRANSNVSQTSSCSSGKAMGIRRKRSRDDDSEDEIYRETREKNNEASRKSRMNKKQKEQEMSIKAAQLEKANKLLKMKVEHMEGVVTMLRSTLLQSALQKGEQKYY